MTQDERMYKRLANLLHPDKETGSDEAWGRLEKAYEKARAKGGSADDLKKLYDNHFGVTTDNSGVIAVSSSDFEKFGCPHCGGIFGHSPISGGGSAVWNCSDCKKSCFVLADGVLISTIGAGDFYPSAQAHPRTDKPVDREKMIKLRKLLIKTDELSDLEKWVSLGFGMRYYDIDTVGGHSSKSNSLPIIAAKTEEGNVNIDWYGQNYYFYFLGVSFKRPVNALLLYPISMIFGGYALSGHVNRELCPPLNNFQKSYHNTEMIERFGADSGSGFTSATVIRYLEEVSKIDTEEVLDVCLRKTPYGKVETIHGNHLEFELMLDILGVKGEEDGYDFKVDVSGSELFEDMTIDRFDNLNGSSVKVTLKKGAFMPTLPFSKNTVYVDPLDTALGDVLTPEVHKPEPRNYDDPVILDLLPTNVLAYKNLETEDYQALRNCGYPANFCYGHGVKLGARSFTFSVSNPLDVAMVAIYLAKALDPVVKQMLLLERENVKKLPAAQEESE